MKKWEKLVDETAKKYMEQQASKSALLLAMLKSRGRLFQLCSKCNKPAKYQLHDKYFCLKHAPKSLVIMEALKQIP